jgi:RNA polymerase sigma factor (sigma-70 family)
VANKLRDRPTIGLRFETPASHQVSGKIPVTFAGLATNKRMAREIGGRPAECERVFREPLNSGPGLEASVGAAQLRAAIDADHDELLQSVAVMVSKAGLRRHRPEVLDLAAEVLHEAVQEALAQSSRFDASRSPTAWVRGIAARLLLSRRRADARARRCVTTTALGEEAWECALQALCSDQADADVAGKIDLEHALARISADERRAVEARYYRGLSGRDLARALGVASAGAARVRVCRALQALRSQLLPAREKVSP